MATEGTKIFLKNSQEMDASGFQITGQQCSGKIKKEEKLVEVGRNGCFLKPWMLF